MKRLNLLSTIVVIFVLTFTSVSYASNDSDQLIDKIPSDSVFFIAIEGTDNTKEAFDKTTLGKIWNSPQVQTFYTTSRDEILKQAKANGEMSDEEQAVFDKVKENFELLFSRPAILGLSMSNVDAPFLIIDAGDKKPQFVELISQLEKLDEEAQIKDVLIDGKKFKTLQDSNDLSAYWGWDDNQFIFFADSPKLEMAAKLFNGAPTDNSSKFSGFYNTDSAIPFVSFNIDIDKIFELARDDMPKSEASTFDTVMKFLGFSDISGCAFKMALRGQDVLVEGKIQTSGSPGGIMGFGRSVNIDTLNSLHGSTMDAVALNYDWMRCYEMVADLIKTLDPNTFAEMVEGIAKTETDLGVRIKGVLPDCLAGPITFNMIPAGKIMGAPQGAFAFVAELDNAHLLEESLIALGKHFAGISEGMLQVASEEHNGRTHHAWIAMPLAIMQLMPTWTIVDNKLVIGSCKEMCFDAADRLADSKLMAGSLANNENFKSVIKQAPGDVWMFRYIDTEVKAKHVLTSMQSFWPMMTMGLAQGGIRLPAMLPSIDAAIKDAPPSFQYYYNDYSGMRFYYQGLGVDLNSGIGGGAGSGAMLAAILMPALGKTKELAKRLVSGTNLKGIGTACNVYAFDHDDKFPPNLEVLIKEVDLSPESLESPIIPNRFKGPAYIYIAGQSASGNAANVVIYENPAYQTEGTNVLYGDGHAEYVKPAKFITDINATYKRLGKEAPKIEFGTFK